MCKWLIEHGAEVTNVLLNQVDQNRNTLLHHALEQVCDTQPCIKLKEDCKLSTEGCYFANCEEENEKRRKWKPRN